MIKIIAGEFKGQIIKSPRSIHPILARIKKSIFDILAIYLKDALFLDLYAGSGAVGIEALSRGCRFCVFVERERICLKYLSRNIIKLNCQQKSYIIKADILKDLFWIEKSKVILNEKFGRQSFDIIFIGAPYFGKDRKKLLNLSVPTLQLVANSDILDKDGWVVVQHSKKELVSFEKFLLKRVEYYGDTAVSFFKLK